jgi:hypothetical protein
MHAVNRDMALSQSLHGNGFDSGFQQDVAGGLRRKREAAAAAAAASAVAV